MIRGLSSGIKPVRFTLTFTENFHPWPFIPDLKPLTSNPWPLTLTFNPWTLTLTFNPDLLTLTFNHDL